ERPVHALLRIFFHPGDRRPQRDPQICRRRFPGCGGTLEQTLQPALEQRAESATGCRSYYRVGLSTILPGYRPGEQVSPASWGADGLKALTGPITQQSTKQRHYPKVPYVTTVKCKHRTANYKKANRNYY